MLKMLQQVFLWIVLLAPLVVVAQVKDADIKGVFDNSVSRIVNKVNPYDKEKKLLDEGFALLNSNDKNAYKTAHRLRKTLKTNRGLVNANMLLAHYFKNKDLIDSSNFYVNKSLEYSLASDSIMFKVRSSAYNILGINYNKKGLHVESKKWHLKGIQFAEKANNTYLYYANTHGLARVYSELGDLQQALKLYKECLQYKEDKQITYGSYINIGTLYTSLKDFEKSNEYLKRGLELAQKDNNARALAVIKFSLASNAQYQNKLDEAISLYNETIEIANKNGLKRLKLLSQMDIGSVFIDLKEYNDAELIYSLAIHDASELGYMDQLLNIYENLQIIAVNTSNYKKAFNFQSNYFKIKDSIGEMQKNMEIGELEVKYKTLRKEKEIKLLQIENVNRELEISNNKEVIRNLKLEQDIATKENEIEKKKRENKILSIQNETEKTQNENSLLKKDKELKQAELVLQEEKLSQEKSVKNIILYSFLILLIPIIGLLFIYYQKLQTQSELNKKQEEINQGKITSLIKDQELKVIKASISGQDKERKRIAQELHDSIGGNLGAIKLQLNSISNKTKEDEIRKINLQIDDTYEQVRDLSHNLIAKKFDKNNFCDVLEEYIKNIGTSGKLKTSFSVYPRNSVDKMEEVIQIEMFKIIQELITNTAKHAKATSIELQLNLIENEINILFEDNGVGFKMEDKIDGIGFRNIKSRLQKIAGTLHIDSRLERGTIIDITIPVVTKIDKISNEI